MWTILYGFYLGFIFCKGWLITLWILCNYLYNYFIQYIIIWKILFIVTDNKIQYKSRQITITNLTIFLL